MGKKISSSISVIVFLFIYIFNSKVIEVKAATDIPRIILESYKIVEGSFAIGQKTVVQLELKNTSDNIGVNNVLITYKSADNNIYSELGNSNQIFLDKIGASEKVSLELTIIVSANTNTDSIPIEFIVDYINTQNDSREKNEFMIFAPVNNLNMVYNISVANSARVGTRAFISANILNNGYSLAKNVRMTITGNIEGEESKDLVQQKKGNSVTYTVGDIEARKSEYIDTGIVFKDSGIQTVTIAFVFDDNNGEEQFQVAGEYDVNVYHNADNVDEKGNNGKVSPAWVISIIIGLAGVVAIIIVIYNKRKQGQLKIGM